MDDCLNDYECPEMEYPNKAKARLCLKLKCDCKLGYEGNHRNKFCKRS